MPNWSQRLRSWLGWFGGTSRIDIDAFTEEWQALSARAVAAKESVAESLVLALDAAQMGQWDLDVSKDTMRRSPRHDEIFGYQTPQPKWGWQDFLQHIAPDDREAVAEQFRQAIAKGGKFNVECRIIWPDRSTRWIAVRARAYLNDRGQAVRVAGVVVDITERKNSEERVAQSLREKEVLLREIHHRVKNNLAVISSLFYLQSTYTQDEATLTILQESQDRVRSMALVHETLYRSADFANVNFAEYARALSEQLMHTYRLSDRIRLRTELAPVAMSIEFAVPCGLILNELVSNALKHAFPNGHDGEVSITLQSRDGEGCSLEVADTGVGLPEGLVTDAPATFGLRVVRSLVRQIDGEFELLPARPGTEARVRFKVPHDRP